MTVILILALASLREPIQEPPAKNPPVQQDDKKAAPKQEEKKPEEKKDPYQDAIKDMSKKDGVVSVFNKDETYYFQVPQNILGRDFLWTTELKQTPSGMYSGTMTASSVVRFEQRGEKVLVRTIDYSVRATEGEEIKFGVEQSNVNPIIKTFSVKAKSPDGGLLIEVGSWFKGDIPDFSVKQALGGVMIDGERSFINKVKVFPTNVNVEVTQTATGGGGGGRNFFGGPPPRLANTGVVLHSIVLLPEKPMMGRLFDSRVGYFATPVQDFGTEAQGSKNYAFIDRYRLEKKDPDAAVSEPVKPIIYYVSREVPAKWRAYVKKGIEDWQPAFEEAGFKNAIIAQDAPDPKDDPDWDPEDARYSVIRWAPLPIQNAMGPHVSDPRSGEIISAHVIMWHDILKLQTAWYFAQASPNDKRAQKLPFPDDLMGECLRFVVAHEVGHTLGLPHNGKSSGTIPCRLLRDPKWTAENGTCTSIMDYARFNYIAQPGDGAALTPKVGMYDKFSIMWGYKKIDHVNNPGDEKRTLDLWASRQVNEPMLRFYDNFDFDDPTELMESLGDNTVEASTYGVANLKRVMGFLLGASTKFGEDYSELDTMYGAVKEQMFMYVFHVLAAVGGTIHTDYHAGRGGEIYTPVNKGYQRSAVKWICDNIFDNLGWLAPRDISLRLGKDSHGGTLGLPGFAMGGLMNDARWGRMLQNESLNGLSAYTLSQMLADIRDSVFKEVYAGTAVGLARRQTQRSYIQSLCAKLGASSESKMAAMSELRQFLALFASGLEKTKDETTRLHLEDLRHTVTFCLTNPDKSRGAGMAAFEFMDFYKPWCSQGLKIQSPKK